MKRVLFIVQNMQMNGANKSLMNLLSVIDKNNYEIDLFAFTYKGILSECIPNEIHLIQEDKYMTYFADSMKDVWKSKNFIGKVIRCLAATEKKITGCPTDPHTKYLLWKFVPQIKKKYDAAIAWNEGASHKFLVEKVNAKVKIGWSHIDDKAWPYHYNLQKKYFPKLDYICTVSNHCREVLINRYDIPEDKIKIVRNIMPVQLMLELAEVPFHLFNSSQINILTITRNEYIKKNSDAINAAIQLHKKGFNTHWWILGAGFSDEQYDMKSDYLTFLRPVKNPYVYLKACDIYVQTSYSGEAWGMGVNEAKIFGKPVIVSKTKVFTEQITNNKTGLIYDHTERDLIEKVVLLLEKENLLHTIQNNLKVQDWSNIKDIDVLYSLIEGYKV